MGISSQEAADAQFTGADDGYDRRQVDALLSRVARTLAAHEAQLRESEAEIGRLEHALDVARASQLDVTADGDAGAALGAAVARVGRQVDGSGREEAAGTPSVSSTSGPGSTGRTFAMTTAHTHQRAHELETAREEARRLRGISNALLAELAVARHGKSEHFLNEARAAADAVTTVHIEAAGDEAALLLEESLAESQRIVQEAEEFAEARREAADRELLEVHQRITALRRAIRDARAQFEEIADTAAVQISFVEDVISIDLEAAERASAPAVEREPAEPSPQ